MAEWLRYLSSFKPGAVTGGRRKTSRMERRGGRGGGEGGVRVRDGRRGGTGGGDKKSVSSDVKSFNFYRAIRGFITAEPCQDSLRLSDG